MLAWIILSVILAILALLLFIPIGADVNYENAQLSVSAKVAGFLLRLYPKKPAPDGGNSKPKKEKKPKKPKKEKPPEEPKSEKPRKKLSFSADEILELVKTALRGFGKFGKLHVDRFMFHYVSAGKDPYSTAMAYNYVNAALSSLYPICSKSFIVKDCDVWTDVDFVEEKMRLDVGLCVTIRLIQVLRVAITIAFGALCILIKNKLRLRRERKAACKEDGQDLSPDEQGTNTQETKEENIPQAERMDYNGQ